MTYRQFIFILVVATVTSCSSSQVKRYAFEANNIQLNSKSQVVREQLGEPMKTIIKPDQEQWLYYTKNESFLEATISMGTTEYETLFVTIDPESQTISNCQFRLLTSSEFNKLNLKATKK